MSEKSEYTIEFRIFAATWYEESDRSISSMRNVKTRLKERYDIEPPRGAVIKSWANKLLTTGSIVDQEKSRRPSLQEERKRRLDDSITAAPRLSVRQRSKELDIPLASLHDLMKKEGYKPWKPTKVQFLSEDDTVIRVQCFKDILLKDDDNRR